MAANCDSNIIINENSGGVETLPPDYSYICGNTEDELRSMINFVKYDFRSDTWYDNIEIMRWYKNEFSIENISKSYFEYLNKVTQ